MPPMGLKELLTQIDQLSREERQKIVDHIQTVDSAEEAAWEDRALQGVLGDAYHADGTIDFDQLYASGRFAMALPCTKMLLNGSMKKGM